MSASASAPVAFDPLVHVDRFNITDVLVDGGVICNSPALYAYLYANELMEYPKVRVFSIGTGISQSKSDALGNTESFSSKSSQAKLLFAFAMNIETAAANTILNGFRTLKTHFDFVRLQTITKASSISNSQYWFDEMRKEGRTMWTDPISINGEESSVIAERAR